MSIPFTVFFQRIRQATDITTQTALAEALGVNRSAITQAKVRDAVPQKWILALSRRCTLSPDWLEFGTGQPRSAVTSSQPSRNHTPGRETDRPPTVQPRSMPAAPAEPEMVYVSKVAARLCAGGGSFELAAIPVAEHPFPHAWLSRMGRPSAMVFMDVVGDSMAPNILDGDMVLVDQSSAQIMPQTVMAVGVEDAIYIKRLERRSDGILLRSDNPAYSDMELYGDELESFRVIGKVVWLCRDCRYA